MSTPLAHRMRPSSLNEIAGHQSVLRDNSILKKMIETDSNFSFILWGPAGCGKTTIARMIANNPKVIFKEISAVSAGVALIRSLIDEASNELKNSGKISYVFIDEIHRFNKSQQDALLPAVENGIIYLVGATTENPYFEINSPLLSRVHLVKLESLCGEDIKLIVSRALLDKENGLGELNISISDAALLRIIALCKGDARIALNILESCSNMTKQGQIIEIDIVNQASQNTAILYDKDGDAHFDTISAFIKSMRGSDPDAALFWLAKMIEGGEDPEFIARRMVIFASEDIGLADNSAIIVAVSAAQALSFVGLPEAKLNLAHAALYLSMAPKSNSVIKSLGEATKGTKQAYSNNAPIHLRDSHYNGAKKLMHGNGYKYPHNYPNNYVKQDYLPVGFNGSKFYFPSSQEKEQNIYRKWLKLKKISDNNVE